MKRTPMKRTAMKRKPKRNPMPEGRWEEAMTRARWSCEAHTLSHECSRHLEVHHLTGRGMGGSADPAIHDLSNLLVVCSYAHQWIETHPTSAEQLGLRRRRRR